MKTIYCIHSFNALILWVYFSKQGDMSRLSSKYFSSVMAMEIYDYIS